MNKQSNKVKRTKVVTFRDDLNDFREIPSLEDCSLEERLSVWYSGCDYQVFKREAKKKSRAVNTYLSYFLQEVERVFEHIQTHHKYEQGKNINEVEECVNALPTHLMASLIKWCNISDCRGLEKWASYELRCGREIARDNISHLSAISPYLDASEISRRYEEKSRPYMIFARLLGEADAASLFCCSPEPSRGRKKNNIRIHLPGPRVLVARYHCT